MRGVEKLAEGLRHNKSLRSLNISECGLGLQGVRSIALALRDNRSLQVLRVSGPELRVGEL